jgi:hypothetical protein
MTWAKFQSFWGKRGFRVYRNRYGIEVCRNYRVKFRFTEPEFALLTREKLEEVYTLWALENYIGK